MANTGASVFRMYGGFRGADFRGEEVNLTRSPDMLNMWRNYKKLDSIETRPGLLKLFEVTTKSEEQIYRLLFFKDKLCMITNFGLYAVKNGQMQLVHGSNEHYPIKFAFEYGGVLYFADKEEYYQFDGDDVEPVKRFVPTTSIGRTPSGGGKTHEDVNLLLQSQRINTFVADGESVDYLLDAQSIDGVLEVVINGYVQDASAYSVDTEAGKVTFNEAPTAPLTAGQDNVSIKYEKLTDANGFLFDDPILKCTIAQEFDNRIFVGGNPDYPNRIWHSSLNEPTYFSDLDYYDEGTDMSLIKGLVPGNNALWVFREPSDTNTNVFYHTPALDDEYGKVYPSSHSSISLGCIGQSINFNDDIVFFSQKGMEGISGDITTEQFVAHRSSVVDRLMTANGKYREMILVEWEGYLLVIMGREVYLADSRAIFQNENHVEYDWYYWQFDSAIVSAVVHEGVLYVGTADGDVCSLTDNDQKRAIHSYWTTPKDKFGAPQMVKTTNKRGCVVEAAGDVSLYAKAEGGEFELIGVYADVKDHFVPRIKRKKFKDIQLKFESNTSFSLETATLEVIIGGYIKR